MLRAQHRPASRSTWWHGALVVLCGGILYANALDGPFIFDDANAIVTNPTIRQLWPPWSMLSPPADTPVAGRPVVNISFALNYALGGLDVRAYHIVSVGLHILCALLVLALVRRTLESPPLADRFGESAGGLALAVALIWEAHALNTEAVNYVTQRTELLAGVFYLLTLYCALRGWDNPQEPGPGGRHALWMLASVVACALGMASKEVMVTAPVAVVLYDVSFSGQPLTVLWKRRRAFYLGLAGAWMILVALLLPGPRSATAGLSTQISPQSYLVSQAVSVMTYLKLSFWPRPLVLHYGNAGNIDVASVWPYATASLALLVAVMWVFRRSPALGFAGVWFFLILAPTSSVVPIATEVMAERRMYLPLVSVVTAAVALVGLLLRRVGARLATGRNQASVSRYLAPAVSSLPVLLAVGLLGRLTLARNAEFSSEVSIWQTVVERRPDNPVGHINLGAAVGSAGDSARAIDHYSRGLELSPAESEAWSAHFNLGRELFRRQSWSEALEHLRHCVDRQPAHPTVHYLIGQILHEQGKTSEAVGHFRAALQANPGFLEAHAALAASLTVLGNTEEAVPLYRTLVANRPDDEDLRDALAAALAVGGRFREAIEEYTQILARRPDNVELYVRLGLTHVAQGDSDEAARWYQRALARRPDYAEAHYRLGNVLAAGGASREAIRHYQEAVRLQPEYAEAHFNLAVTLRSSGLALEALHHAGEAARLRPDDPKAQDLVAVLRAATR